MDDAAVPPIPAQPGEPPPGEVHPDGTRVPPARVPPSGAGLRETETPSYAYGSAPDAPALGGHDPIQLQASDPRRSPDMDWPPWTAPVALIGGLALALIGGLIVDVPAAVLGVKISSSHTPGGIEIADTVIQDIGFVVAAVYCAKIGGRVASAWQFGLRRPGVGWRSATGLLVLLLAAFLLLSIVWSVVTSPGKEKILEQLGANETTSLLLLSAGLTCVVAPICEEFLFRGYIFTALRTWHGTWPAAVITGLVFGGVHAGSAPALDLVPLAALGFGLCLLYRYTGSLYPGIAAHSLNNSLAFGLLESWTWWQVIALMVSSLAAITVLMLAGKRIGLITPEASTVAPST